MGAASDLIPDAAFGEDQSQAAPQQKGESDDLIPPTAIAEGYKSEAEPEDTSLAAIPRKATAAVIGEKPMEFATGTWRAGALQTLQTAAGPGNILDPETWRKAAHAITELPKTVPAALEAGAKTAIRWAADPITAARKALEPAEKMTPEEAGFAYGPTAVNVAALAAAPAAGLVARGGRMLGLTEDLANWRNARVGGPAIPSVDAAEGLGGAKSAGTAATTIDARVASASPEIQQAWAEIKARGGVANEEALNRHLDADSLPVPVRLRAGQATQDPNIISDEINRRGLTGMAEDIKTQTDRLKQNFPAIRESAAPEVFSTNPVEHGDKLIEAYKAKDAAAQADISAKYQALRDAAGGEFPVDAKALYDDAVAKLHKQLLFEHAPPQEMAQLARFAEQGSMTFENYEAMRTNLARIMRGKNPDSGNLRAAAGIIREAMEALPLTGGAAELKPLADTARAAAKAQFDAMRADPAYNAAVNDKVSPDRFVSRFVTGGDRDKVALMKENLAHDPQAVQTMSAATIDDLAKSAGMEEGDKGTFTYKRFSNRYEALSPKLQHLVDPKSRGQLEALRNTARSMYQLPEGEYSNKSSTFVAALKDAAEHGLRGAFYAKGGPLGGTVFDWTTQKLKDVALKGELRKATAPLAGVETPSSDAALQAASRKKP